MAKDFRYFLAQLTEVVPEDTVRVTREVDPCLEAAALIHNLEAKGRYPLVLFDNVKNMHGKRSSFPLCMNMAGSRQRMAVAIGLSPDQWRMELTLKMQQLLTQNRNIGTATVARGEAPVKEVRKARGDADLFEFPIPKYYEHDGGYYITGMPVITRHLSSGHYNISINRFHVKDPATIMYGVTPGTHSRLVYNEYQRLNRPCPVVIVSGHHLATYMATQWAGPYGEDEYADITALLQEPLRLVPSETWGEDFLVPADAEIIIEAEALPGEWGEEGPFVEHFGYYKGFKGVWPDGPYGYPMPRNYPVLHVKAITHRRDAWFVPHAAWGNSCVNLLTGKAAALYERVRLVAPLVKAIYCPVSGGGSYWTFVSLKHRQKGDARAAILTIMAMERGHNKYVVAVDDDVDVFDEQEVWWAVASRTTAEDFIIIPALPGGGCDPEALGASHLEEVSTRLGIDATRPFKQPFSLHATVSEELKKKMDPATYIERVSRSSS